jgi:hypothetical protein
MWPPPLVVTARGGVAVLSSAAYSLSGDGFTPGERVALYLAVPLYDDGTRCGRAGHTSSGAAEDASPALE